MKKKSIIEKVAHESSRPYVGTTVAARALGISIGSVQRMMDEGTLTGHLTPGGHRRVAMDSIHHYRRKIGMPAGSPATDSDPLKNIIAIFTSNQELIIGLGQGKDAGYFEFVQSPVDILMLKMALRISFIDYLWLQKYKANHAEIRRILEANAYIFNVPPEEIHSPDNHRILSASLSPDFFRGYSLSLRHPVASL